MKISTLLIALGGIVSPLYADAQVRGDYMDNLSDYLENTGVYEEGQVQDNDAESALTLLQNESEKLKRI